MKGSRTPVNTFRELYCAACRCRPEDFGRRLFWRCLHRSAVPLAPALLVANPEFFAPDRELIDAVGRASTLKEVSEEARCFALDARNREWWRRRAHVRVSTHRLQALARVFLAARPQPVHTWRFDARGPRA
jgi:hypothetical protein